MIEVQKRSGVERSEGRSAFVLKTRAGRAEAEKEKKEVRLGGRAANTHSYTKVIYRLRPLTCQNIKS